MVMKMEQCIVIQTSLQLLRHAMRAPTLGSVYYPFHIPGYPSTALQHKGWASSPPLSLVVLPDHHLS